jgi:hypothetical protein
MDSALVRAEAGKLALGFYDWNPLGAVAALSVGLWK